MISPFIIKFTYLFFTYLVGLFSMSILIPLFVIFDVFVPYHEKAPCLHIFAVVHGVRVTMEVIPKDKSKMQHWPNIIRQYNVMG